MTDPTLLVTAAGGLGLFLLGITIMTDGLRTLAGDAIRHILMRFTRSPLSGAATGAAATALLQSSSATTVAAPDNDWKHAALRAQQTADEILTHREALRATILADTASGRLTIPESTDYLEAVRWLVRVSQHLARITWHLEHAANATGMEST